MDNFIWTSIQIFLLESLAAFEPCFDEKSTMGVTHYINYDEYEMAFEILFLEAMKLRYNKEVDLNKSRKIGLLLKLDKESVFDENFWDKFEGYIAANS